MSPNLLNKYAIELLCYNIPNELLEGSDIFVVLAKSINYLNNVPYNALTNFDDKLSIDTFIFSIINPVRVISFIDKIKKLAFN